MIMVICTTKKSKNCIFYTYTCSYDKVINIMHKNIFHTNEIQNKVLQIPRLWKVSQNKVLVRKDVIIRVLILKISFWILPIKDKLLWGFQLQQHYHTPICCVLYLFFIQSSTAHVVESSQRPAASCPPLGHNLK